MAFYHDLPDREPPLVVSAARRWLYAVGGHFTFCVCMGAAHSVSILPCAVLTHLFIKMGGIVFLIAAVISAGLSGAVWTAVHRMSWELQFQFPVYLFRELWKHFCSNFRQGYCMGVIMGLLCAFITLPLYLAELFQKALPFGIVCLMGITALLLPVISAYAYYQIMRWELTVIAAIKNSVLLLFSMSWRSVVVCVIWIAFALALLSIGQIVVPVCFLCGLTVILCITEQTFIAPQIDAIMHEANIDLIN